MPVSKLLCCFGRGETQDASSSVPSSADAIAYPAPPYATAETDGDVEVNHVDFESSRTLLAARAPFLSVPMTLAFETIGDDERAAHGQLWYDLVIVRNGATATIRDAVGPPWLLVCDQERPRQSYGQQSDCDEDDGMLHLRNIRMEPQVQLLPHNADSNAIVYAVSFSLRVIHHPPYAIRWHLQVGDTSPLESVVDSVGHATNSKRASKAIVAPKQKQQRRRKRRRKRRDQ